MSEREIDLEWLKCLEPNSEAEDFVRQEVKAGRVADLVERFPNSDDRVICASVLEALFLSNEVPRKGVWVRGTIVLGDLNMENAEIEHEVGIVESVFRDDVSFIDVSALRVLSFVDSTFIRAALFHRLKAESSVFFRGTNFHGPVNFCAAKISGQLSVSKAKFLDIDNQASFNSMSVNEGVFLNETLYKGGLDLRHAHIKRDLEVNEAEFLNKEAEANFSLMMVENDLFIEESEFHGSAIFKSVKVNER